MAEAASISYGNECSSEPRKTSPGKHIPDSSKERKTHHPWRGLCTIEMAWEALPMLVIVMVTLVRYFPFVVHKKGALDMNLLFAFCL
jgi:hypothetical protein